MYAARGRYGATPVRRAVSVSGTQRDGTPAGGKRQGKPPPVSVGRTTSDQALLDQAAHYAGGTDVRVRPIGQLGERDGRVGGQLSEGVKLRTMNAGALLCLARGEPEIANDRSQGIENHGLCELVCRCRDFERGARGRR